MRVILLLSISLSLSLVSGQAAGTRNKQPEQARIPRTLAEAHAELERILSPQMLADIDVMPSEKGMIRYFSSRGMDIANDWGLWRGSPLAKHMQGLGFTYPGDMRSAILVTFWRKRHGQDLCLDELAAAVKESTEAERKAQEEEKNRVQEANAAVRNMMMGLRFERRDVPKVPMPTGRGVAVRFLCPFRDGVFLAAYCQGRIPSDLYTIRGRLYVDSRDANVRAEPPFDDSVARGFYRDPNGGELRKMKPGEDFYILGFYLDLADRKIRRIRVAEVNEVYAAVVAGDRAWFAGLTSGKPVLVGVGERDRITMPLPQEDEIPDLGLDGRSLLAVYAKTIYRLTDREWTLIHSGDILLPRSGLPPQRHGNRVFFRDEGSGETRKRLWWLTLGEQSRLSALHRDVGVIGEVALGRGDCSSYCVTTSGDLWACVAAGTCLLRRSQDGRYSIAIINGSVRFTGDLFGTRKTDESLSVSAVTALSDDTLLLAGNAGLYRLKGNELVQELAFISQETTGGGRGVRHWDWNPNTILVLNDQSYVIGCGSWEGAYLLRKGNDGQWSCLSLDGLRDTVIW